MVQSFGGKGRGPGEFLGFEATYAGEGSQAFAIDLNNWRITRTNLKNGFSEVRTIHPDIRAASGKYPVDIRRDGTSLWYTAEREPDATHPVGHTWRFTLVLVPFDQSTLMPIKSRRSGYRNQRIPWEGGTRSFGAPFGPNIDGTLTDSSLFVSFFYSGFEITEYSLDANRTPRNYHYDFPVVPLTESELESIYEPDMFRSLKGRILFPENKALIETMWGPDKAGRLWVGRYPFSFLDDPPEQGWFHYDIVDTSTDRIVGSVRLQGRLFGVKGDRAFAFSNTLANQGILLEYRVPDLRGAEALP
ncbi:MAG: hypothetical protein R6U98_14830 [Pirellulaceae bacterium]